MISNISKIKLGDIVYYVPSRGHGKGLIIPSEVIEINHWYDGYIVSYNSDDDTGKLSTSILKSDCEKYEEQHPFVLDGLNICSEEFWIDELVGHAVYLNEDIFLTLEQARKYCKKTNKKHIGRRLRNMRKSKNKFISTHENLSTVNKIHPRYNKKKKVYVA